MGEKTLHKWLVQPPVRVFLVKLITITAPEIRLTILAHSTSQVEF